MRADRLLSILLLLQSRGQITAKELSQRLEVSPRTIHRDMEALSMAGVPVYAQRGTGGGWILPDEYRTETVGLNVAEVQAIFLANPHCLLTDLGLNRAAEHGLIKLLSVLPATHQQDAEQIRQRIHIDVSGWRSREEAAPFLQQLHAAVLNDRRIHISYARPGADPVERTLDPLGLVAKGGTWYLISYVAGEPRTYRVSRISSVEILDEQVIRPPGFDLAAFWDGSKRDFVERLPQYWFTALVTDRCIEEFKLIGRWSHIESQEPVNADPEQRKRASIRSERFEDALGLALGFGDAMEVIEPLALREAVVRGARAILERYAGSPLILSGSGANSVVQ